MTWWEVNGDHRIHGQKSSNLSLRWNSSNETIDKSQNIKKCKQVQSYGCMNRNESVLIRLWDMALSENSVPNDPMVNDHYPYEKWLFHWEYTQHFQTIIAI